MNRYTKTIFIMGFINLMFLFIYGQVVMWYQEELERIRPDRLIKYQDSIYECREYATELK